MPSHTVHVMPYKNVRPSKAQGLFASIGLLFSMGLSAQEQPAATQSVDTDELQEVVVTGTRAALIQSLDRKHDA